MIIKVIIKVESIYESNERQAYRLGCTDQAILINVKGSAGTFIQIEAEKLG
jgi:hypothetical protein